MCPGCDTDPAPGAVPKETLEHLEARHGDDDWWDTEAWWCPSCLAARMLAVHTDNCRCAGCRPAGRRTAA